MRSLLVVALMLAGSRVEAQPLPPPGPPPDPTRGESYDGRPPESEPWAESVALAVPRAVLFIPRMLLWLAQPPALAGLRYLDDAAGRPGRVSLGPVLSIASDSAPIVGVAVTVRDVGGKGRSTLGFRLTSGGPRFADAEASIVANPALRVGWNGQVHLRYRDDEPFYRLIGGDRPEIDGDETPGRLQALALDGNVDLALRPGGTASPWRFRVGASAGLRRFGLATAGAPDPATVPGFARGATFVAGHLGIEHVSDFDVSRDAGGLDASLELAPTFGVGFGDDTRYLTIIGRASFGQPVGGGRAIVISAMVGDQQSSGGVDFYDRFALGGGFFHRGFSSARFRGGSLALFSFDYRFPLATWADGVLFVENGGAFGEGFAGFQAAGMRTSVGAGLHLFRAGRLVFRGIVGLGVGEGFHTMLSFGPP